MDDQVTVVLDCNLTPELIREGFQREVVSKLQNMRKDAGFEVSDRIVIAYQADDELAAAIEAGRDFIMRSVLAVEMNRADNDGTQWDINGKKAVLSVSRA